MNRRDFLKDWGQAEGTQISGSTREFSSDMRGTDELAEWLLGVVEHYEALGLKVNGWRWYHKQPFPADPHWHHGFKIYTEETA